MESSWSPYAMLPVLFFPVVQIPASLKLSVKINFPYSGRVSNVGVIGRVAEGRGVKVGVGGNQMMVALGVMVGVCKVLLLIERSDWFAIGKQATIPIRRKHDNSKERTSLIILVYYNALSHTFSFS